VALPAKKLVSVRTREEWRAWLKAHYKTRTEAWLVYPKKHTGKPRVSYNDAVEEALCFGWIDSTARTMDADHFAQRFTPRAARSTYSQANIERLRSLVRRGRVAKDVLPTLPDLAERAFVIPKDILTALRASPNAWKHFQAFSPPYVRIRIAFIDGARKRPAEFRKRLAHFVRMTEENKMFGFGGIEKHY
jgi:uncharacterized protein YdeI (YjbR/CyaY-like superfamily)